MTVDVSAGVRRLAGTRVTRTEDRRLLTSGGVFTDDLVDPRLDGAVSLTFVRSPIAHARIVSIRLSEVRRAPGVVAAYTGEDLAGLPGIRPPVPDIDATYAQPLLARDVVRFVGEAVAVVVTDGRHDGEDAAELVEVDYDPLPAVTEVAAALADTTLVHAGTGTNTVRLWGARGDFDDGPFAACEVVVRQAMRNQRLAPAPLEVRAIAVGVDPSGPVPVWLPSQGGHVARRALAAMLALDESGIRVITPDVGGAFGAKAGADPEHGVALWVAQTLGRAVRWVESRSESLLAMTHGRAQEQVVTIGGDRDGRIRAYRLDIVQDCGAYPRLGAVLPALTRLMTPGTYDIPHVESAARCVLTTTTPVAAYRGAGRPEATAALERAVDLFATELDLDPVVVRRRNLLAPFAGPRDNGFGGRYDNADYPGALERVLEAADYPALRRAQATARAAGAVRQLGIGVACYVEITGGGSESGDPSEYASMEVHRDGTATVLTGTSPHGQGHATAWAMLATDETGIPLEAITVRHGDTELVARGGGTAGSRSLQQGGVAVREAALLLVAEARRRAASRLEADVEDLVVDRSRAAVFVRGTPSIAVTLADLAADAPLRAETTYRAAGPTYPFGAHLAVVEVDMETGLSCLVRLVAVDDAGTLLNPLLADGQLHGGLAQGVAQALLEHMVYDAEGTPLTATLADYTFVSAVELPSFELVRMETPTSLNPLGAKGIGESATIGSTPAVHNAVLDALRPLGVRHVDMPLTPQAVWQAMVGSGR